METASKHTGVTVRAFQVKGSLRRAFRMLRRQITPMDERAELIFMNTTNLVILQCGEQNVTSGTALVVRSLATNGKVWVDISALIGVLFTDENMERLDFDALPQEYKDLTSVFFERDYTYEKYGRYSIKRFTVGELRKIDELNRNNQTSK